MPSQRNSNIAAYEIEASDNFSFPTIAAMSAVAGGSTVTQDIDISNLGVPAIRLAEIMIEEFTDAAGATELGASDPLAGLLSISVVDNDTIRISLNPSGVDNADAGTEYFRLEVDQDDPGEE